MRALTLTTAAAVLAAVLTGCAGSTDQPTPADTPAASKQADAKPAAPATPPAAKDAKITKKGRENHELWGPDSYVVHYKITNNGDKAADYLIGIELLDSDGDVLGSTGAGTEKLGPGKTSTGNAVPLDVEIDNGKLSDIVDARIDYVERTDPI